ncbi:MAG: helix-turn-helix domain-containing protein [Castellaniella sp.]|nr:helix-turn-helix domain-containing protein [Castellaniella sp.]
MSSKQSPTVFGRRLRTARLRADIPQDRLGVAIGLDEGSASARVSRYETGIHEPPHDVAAKLARALDVPAAYLYCEDDALAEVILAWNGLGSDGRQRVLDLLRAET